MDLKYKASFNRNVSPAGHLTLDINEQQVSLALREKGELITIWVGMFGGYTNACGTISQYFEGLGVNRTFSVKVSPFRQYNCPKNWISLEITLHFEFICTLFARAYTTTRTYEEIAALLAEYTRNLNRYVHTPLVELIIQYID
jgi:hypothetical protein